MTGLEDSNVGRDRYAGYLHGLASHHIKLNEKLVFKGNYSYESGLAGADYFLSLKNPPTAIICANDSMAIAAIGKITQYGLNVPNDISVIGFDDITVASQIHPPLTTIAAPIRKMAKLAVEMLIEQIQHKKATMWMLDNIEIIEESGDEAVAEDENEGTKSESETVASSSADDADDAADADPDDAESDDDEAKE